MGVQHIYVNFEWINIKFFIFIFSYFKQSSNVIGFIIFFIALYLNSTKPKNKSLDLFYENIQLLFPACKWNPKIIPHDFLLHVNSKLGHQVTFYNTF